MARIHHARVVAAAEMAVKVLPLDQRFPAVALIMTIKIALRRFGAKVELRSSRREDGIEVRFETCSQMLAGWKGLQDFMYT